MIRTLVLFVALNIGVHGLAQDSEMPKPSLASQKYHEYRLVETTPPFGLSKVKKLIKQIKSDNEDNRRMSTKLYDSLSFDEKFTYAMIHGEDSSQNCDAMPPILDENIKVFSYVPGPFYDEATWSQRQRDFLNENRSRVIGLIRSTIRSQTRVGTNIKAAILELNAWELIPELVQSYNLQRKDHDILTVLMLLMKENKYAPFLASSTYKKFYGEDSNYQAYIAANAANIKLTIERANAFYRSRKK